MSRSTHHHLLVGTPHKPDREEFLVHCWAARRAQTVTVIGTGPMGAALADALSGARYDVRMIGARGRSLHSALAETQIVFYALPLEVALATALMMPAGRHRILIDVTNPSITAGSPAPQAMRSAGELLSCRLPTWRVVKAFNTVAASLLGSPMLGDQVVTVPVAGNDPSARRHVCAMAHALGFHAVEAGDITASRAIEALAVLLWRISNVGGYRGQIGFRLLTADQGDGAGATKVAPSLPGYSTG